MYSLKLATLHKNLLAKEGITEQSNKQNRKQFRRSANPSMQNAVSDKPCPTITAMTKVEQQRFSKVQKAKQKFNSNI